jgi:glucose/arabinose dehydrogenase
MRSGQPRLSSAFFWILLTPALAFPAQSDDLEPGLVAEYFEFSGTLAELPIIPAGRAPTLVRVEPNIDYGAVRGSFYGTKLSTNFFARWTGFLRIQKEGLTNFYLDSDDGSRLYIDGDLILDNRDGRAMEQKADRILLKAGDHSIKVEFFQRDGAAGVLLGWKPQGQLRALVPRGALFHRKGSEKISWDREAWDKRPDGAPMERVRIEREGRYLSTDYGSFLSRTVQAAPGALTAKGLAIKVGRDASVLFDTDLLRFSAAWTGDFLKYPPERDGIYGIPAVAGRVRFSTNPRSPGWATGGDWKDPRPEPFGPLPRDRAHYRGLYVHGDHVILSYTVGGAEVLEMPGFESGAFTRTFQIGRSASPLAVLLAEGAEGEPGALGLPAGATITKDSGRVLLRIPPLEAPVRLKVGFPAARLSPPEDLEALTRGGPSRWSGSVETKGALGKGPGAYLADTLAIPFENPWDSYMRIVAFDFFPDGRAALATVDGDVWIVSGIDETLERLTWKRFAAGLYQPLGLKIVDGTIYALGRDQITRLHDLNGDGEADFYENFNNDLMDSTGFHEFAMNLETDSNGDFYYTKAATAGTGAIATPTPHYGCLLKVSRDGQKLEVVARGFRAPNGLAIGPRDEIVVADNQGNWVPECPILSVTRGGFYGYVLKEFPETASLRPEPPIAWLPMDLDNSSGGGVWVPGDRWGPFKGRLLHTSYGQSALFLVLRDENDPAQGGVVKFPLRFSSGIMRARFHPKDGQLYVAGLRGWQTTGAQEGCFTRVRYAGREASMPVSLRIRRTGIDLTFTDPLDREAAGDLENYSARWFTIERSEGYGSPEFWVTQAKKRGREELPIAKVTLSAPNSVSLEIPTLRPAPNVLLKFKIRGANGAPIAQEIALTIHKLPER